MVRKMEERIVVLDLGTTNIKTMLFDAAGNALAEASCPTPVIYEGERMEIFPEKHWESVRGCIKSMLEKVPEAPVSAITIASMASTLIPIDDTGTPLYNAISWSDTRARKYCEEYTAHFLQGEHIADCGQYPLIQYSGFKLRWLRDHEPGIYRKMRKWINISEFIYHRLIDGDEYYTDCSVASRNMIFDVKKKSWNPAALAFFDIDPEWLPKPLPSGTVIGNAAKEIRGKGISEKTRIVLGGHDHMCSLLGAGITEPGTVLNSTGTSEAVECLLSEVGRPEDYARRWINLENSVLADRIAAVIYVGASGRVDQSMRGSVVDSDKAFEIAPMREPLFLPPERAMLSTIRGELRGVSTIFTGPELMRAVRDGIYLEARRGIERILGADQAEGTVLRCVGGAARDLEEMQRRSDAVGYPIETCEDYNASAAGAFLLGAFGCGLIPDLKEGAKQMYGSAKKIFFTPDPGRKEKYTEIYREHYLKMFPEGARSL